MKAAAAVAAMVVAIVVAVAVVSAVRDDDPQAPPPAVTVPTGASTPTVPPAATTPQAAVTTTTPAAPTRTCPAPDEVSAQARAGVGVPWAGDFRTGDMSQYDVQSLGGVARVVTVPAHPGYTYAALLRTTTVAPEGVRRVHLHGPEMGWEGTHLFYGQSVRLPKSFPTGAPGFQLVFEFFGPPYTDTPPVSLLVDTGGTQLAVSVQHAGGVVARVPATRDVWHDFLWEVVFSKTKGTVRVWHRIAGRGAYVPLDLGGQGTTLCAPTLDPDMTVAHPMPGDYHTDAGVPYTVLHAADRASSSPRRAAPRPATFRSAP